MAPAAPVDPETAAAAEKLKRAQCAMRWIAELNQSEKAQHKWLQRAKKIAKRYRKDDSDTVKDRRFAMLWSNTQTVQPAVYSRPPQPVVTRRFNDPDPVARAASEVLERCLTTSVDMDQLDNVLRQNSLDYVLLGRGQTWERYVPTHGPEVTPEIDLQVVTGGDGSDDCYTDAEGKEYDRDDVQFRQDGSPYALGEPYKPVVYEQSITDYVNWDDFGHSPARTWDEVVNGGYVWRRVYLSRQQCVDRFGEDIGKRVPLDWGVQDRSTKDDAAKLEKKAAVYEIWDASTKHVFWISKSLNECPLDERDDLLGVTGFFPCPKPLLATTANDSTIPVPDYVYYQDQAEEIDKLTARIGELQDAIKVRGFYAADAKSNINALLNSSNTMLIPVPDWLTFTEGGGAAGKVEWWPINLVVQALDALIQQRQQLVQDIYQITGIADIMRGMGDPRATATQEEMKGQWGTLRVRDRQIEMMRFARDILRIKGEVIAGKFSPETWKAMSGVKLPTNAEKQQLQAQVQQFQMVVQQAQATGQPPPQPPIDPSTVQETLASPSWEDVEALLQDNAARKFRVDIETDSTIEPNEQQEKKQAIEFIQAVGGLIQQWGPAVEAQPALAPMAGAFIKWAARKFRAGRELEDTIDTAMDKVVEGASQPKDAAAPQADPTKIAVAQIHAQETAMQEQGENQRAAANNQLKQQELAIKAGDQQLKVVALNRDPRPQVIS
jgi:hypothetical protein